MSICRSFSSASTDDRLISQSSTLPRFTRRNPRKNSAFDSIHSAATLPLSHKLKSISVLPQISPELETVEVPEEKVDDKTDGISSIQFLLIFVTNSP